MQAKPSYIPTLDGWRGIAIFLVIAAHSIHMLRNSETAIGLLLARVFSHVGYGVDVFFCLSGYLICTLLLKERATSGQIAFGGFYIRRAFRILPPIFAYLLTVVILSRAGILPRLEDSEVLSVLFFARNYANGTWYTTHFWSLAVEEHFYFVMPWLLLIRSPRKLLYTLLALIGLCMAIRWIEFSHAMFPANSLQFRTENRFDALGWGAVLAVVLHYPRSAALAARWLQLRFIGPVFLTVLVLLLSSDWSPYRRTLIAATLPLLIGYTVLNAGRLPGRWLETPALRWLGRLSYSLYIWQNMFLVPDVRHMPFLQSAPVAFGAAIGCAILSYYFLERPCIRLGHQLSDRVKAGAHPFRGIARQ